MATKPPVPGFGPGPAIPAVIQRIHDGVVEWLHLDDPPEWRGDKEAEKEALVFTDIGLADKRARALSQELREHIFPVTRVRPPPTPFFSTVRNQGVPPRGHDWREGAPNCGVE